MILRNAKLKGPIGRVYPIFIIGVTILAVGEFLVRNTLISNGVEITRGPVIIVIIASLFFLGMGIYQWWRYRLWVYFGLGLLVGASTLQSMHHYTEYFTMASYIINVMLVVIYIIITWSVLAGQERFEIKSRQLFKLAADNIEETGDGFTARPFSAGKEEYTNDQLLGLARYLKSMHIVLPVHKNEGVYMCFSLGRSLMIKPDPITVSYVMFSNKGDISVHISAFDYKQFNKRITFDQLCNSMGNTFQRFLAHYKSGHEERILTELRSV